MTINVKHDIQSVGTVAEFDAVVEKFKLQHPAKYAVRLESGDLAKQRDALKPVKVEEEKVEEKPKKVK